MRIATVLVFTALICASQAQFFSGLSGIFGSARDRIEKLRETIDGRLEQAEKTVQNAYQEARERIDDAYNRLEEAAEGVRDRVKKAVDQVEESVQKQVDEILQSAVSEGVDVSTCTALVKTFRAAGGAIVNDNIKCVTDKVEQGKNIATDVLDIGQESLDVITGIRGQSNKCVENIDSITEQAAAIACLTSVGAKASWALATKVPAVAKEFAEATALIFTLQPALAYCTSKNSILDFVEQGSIVVADVRKCVADRISAVTSTNNPEVPPVPEVPQVPEVPHVPEVPTTTPGLVLPGFEEVPQKKE